MPLLAPGVMRKSGISSKLVYLRVVRMSPALPPSSPRCSVTGRRPCLTSQPVAGKVGPWVLCQPSVVLPSKRRCQPAAASCLERVLGAVCASVGRVPARIAVARRVARMGIGLHDTRWEGGCIAKRVLCLVAEFPAILDLPGLRRFQSGGRVRSNTFLAAGVFRRELRSESRIVRRNGSPRLHLPTCRSRRDCWPSCAGARAEALRFPASGWWCGHRRGG